MTSTTELLEQFIAKQLVAYSNLHGLMPRLRTAYRWGIQASDGTYESYVRHSATLENGDLATLALFELSAAFDTDAHDVILRRLRVSYNTA